MIKLGYAPKEKFKWKVLQKDCEEYNRESLNGKFIITINELLWGKVKNIMYLRRKGYDALILIDGKKRTGKSTMGKTVAYLLNPSLTINNYVAGLEEAPEKIDNAKEEDSLIFDEGSLVASSKDGMKKKNKQLEKIIDVVGQKRLTLIFCMPEFFKISKTIAVNHSLFLIHVYTDSKLNRGRFAYFGTNRKKLLYEIGKKNYGSYSKPKSNFTGKFVDFHVPFEEEYLKLKKESLKEALNPDYKKPQPPTENEIRTQLLIQFRENAPEVTIKELAKGFGVSERSIYRRKQGYTPPEA